MNKAKTPAQKEQSLRSHMIDIGVIVAVCTLVHVGYKWELRHMKQNTKPADGIQLRQDAKTSK